MELVRFSTRPPPFLISSGSNFRANNPPLRYHCKKSYVQSALPETAVSILVSSVVVGAAATLLAQRLKNSQNSTKEETLKDCEECKGSGLCSECKGEGYVFKNISEENARKARMAAKNAATRYTAGLPTKWTYCTKCNSARTCRNCNGSGQVKL
ncbi:hypothetical protein LUZ60_006887 [Juncus effusus]|nr:hypothetical protein LUZ60_006887 [Juncus effusus]